MADRDVTVDVVARDKTSPAIKSVNRNLKSVEKSWKDVDGQGKRTVAAAGEIAKRWEQKFKRIGSAASRWASSGDGIGKKMVRGIGAGLKMLGSLGESIGNGLSKAINMAGPYVQVAMAAVLVGAAVAAAPAIAGAIVGGAGMAGIVGGVLVASKDARVAAAFDGLQETVGSGLQDAARRFVPATIEAIGEAKKAFQGLMPDLRRLFDVTAPWLAPLAHSFGVAAQRIMDGITKAVTKAGPIFKVIVDSVMEIGDAIGDVFADLSDNGTTMAAGLKAVFMVVEGAIRVTGMTLNFLVETVQYFIDKIPGAKAALNAFVGSATNTKTTAYDTAGGFQKLAEDAKGAAQGLTEAKQKADEFVDSNISLSNAQIAARDAVRNTTKEIIENSKAKIGNSERADRNRKALNDLASAFNTETTAGEKSGISAGKAAAAYANNRAKLIAMAEKAGYSKTAAERLAAQLLKIPKNVNTDVNVDTKTAETNVRNIKKAIGEVKGKTVYITVQERTNSNGSIHVSGKGGSGTLTYGELSSWQGAGVGAGMSRTGGPTHVESTVHQTLNVSLDGMPFYNYTARAIGNSERRTAWRTKVGRR